MMETYLFGQILSRSLFDSLHTGGTQAVCAVGMRGGRFKTDLSVEGMA